MEINVGGEIINISESALQLYESTFPRLPDDLQHSINANPELKRCTLLGTELFIQYGAEGVRHVREIIKARKREL